MTSLSLKRPLELDAPANANTDLDSPSESTTTGSSSSDSQAINSSNKQLNGTNSPTSQTKRRCNTLNHNTNIHHNNSSSILKNYTNSLSPIADQVAASLKDEIIKTIHQPNYDEPVVFTLSQTQAVCEHIIKDREQKLREEYERILHRQLTEQYEMFLKASYFNSLESRFPPPPSPKPPSISASNQALNALATAFTTIQKTAASAVPSVAGGVAMSDLSTFAVNALSAANVNHGGLTPSQIALNFQHQAAAMQAQHKSSSGNMSTSPVLLVSNLDEQLANPEALFTLFGVFGDVIRVKILFNKKDNALIQMADASQAHVAQSYLDKQKVFGKPIRVTRSKHQIVQMPRDQSDASLTKDFTSSPLHRFKIPGSRNYQNIYPPSSTLHISNIPPTVSEDDIKKQFRNACNFTCASFKFFPKDRKMALMRFETNEQATIALIKMHNYPISEENHLRVSFSKSYMQQ